MVSFGNLKLNKNNMKKKIKLFEAFLNEAPQKFVLKRPGGNPPPTNTIDTNNDTDDDGENCSSRLCNIVMPTITNITELVNNYSQPSELTKLQTEATKLLKLINDTIRSGRSGTAAATELDWEVAPKAPIFVLNLKQIYPQNEEKYYELWYKAAKRLPTFNYGGAIAIFKTYAKREELMLEDHDYDNELTEDQINNL